MTKRAGQILAMLMLAAVLAAPAAAAKGGGRAGGGRIGGSPSITRQAPARPAPQQAAPGASQGSGTGSAAQNSQKKPIDQGVDPKDYGRRPAASAQPAAGNGAASQGFFGGGSFFGNGFSLWPWLWFGSMGQSQAADGTAVHQETFMETLSRWWNEFMSFFQHLPEALGLAPAASSGGSGTGPGSSSSEKK